METFILGCGGMMPLPGRHLTSVLLRREGELFLFDCGEGTQVSLRSLNLRWKKINTIFISHTHADHITGLPGILMLSAQVDRSEPLVIIGPPKIKEYIETSRDVLDMYINYEIEIREIENPSEPQVVYVGDGYKVRSFPVKHSKVCVGYTLEEEPRPGTFFPDKAKKAGVPVGPMWSNLQKGEEVKLSDGTIVKPDDVMGSERKGRKFSFVTDTMYKESIIAEVAGSDLFICEGMFEKELEESAREKKHLTAHQAGIIASKAGGIKKMGLIHFSPRYTERQLKILRKEARENFEETFLCRDQMVLKIPNED
ncbi:MAG: ribonuclease Z [Spirochaetaceae bacterium]|jgi:ribonuclease Z|nr:ribonuclease Z [Spirochaetaceae bacterium]